jgi:hypothetical protein
MILSTRRNLSNVIRSSAEKVPRLSFLAKSGQNRTFISDSAHAALAF